MDVAKYVINGTIALRVIPNAGRTEVKEENGILKVYVHAVPDNNKANQELMTFFKKELGLKVEIIRGEKSRKKVLRVLEFKDKK